MQSNLEGITIAVLGGDARYLELINELVRSGARVQVIGLPVQNSDKIVLASSIIDCLNEVEAVVLPILGIDDKGLLHCVLSEQTLHLTEDVLAALPKQTLIFTGLAGVMLRKLTADLNLRLIQLMDLDEVAILNAIPSAEGVVQMAMEMLPITIHGSKAFVVGFGRTGKTLARLLSAMGARIGVIARKNGDLARIEEMNMQPINFADMQDYLGDADVIFNTVPAPVLTADVLTAINPDAVLIDLASAPGGTDFQQAVLLGIRAVLAPSLPGRVAPKTAGLILAQAVTRYLVRNSVNG